MALASLGMPLYFSTFFPIILVTSLLAGVPAGAFTALSAVVIVWWAFMPPVFQFGPLDKDDIDRCQMFLLGVSVLIWFSHLCRGILRSRRKLLREIAHQSLQKIELVARHRQRFRA